jgi:peptide/nickel transport system substrate-binding protein
MRNGTRVVMVGLLLAAMSFYAGAQIVSADVVKEIEELPPSYNEAPMLAEMVATEQLPPVEERLPRHPKVVGPPLLREVGRYGGTLKFGIAHEVTHFNWLDPGEVGQDIGLVMPGRLLRWTYDIAETGADYELELAKSLEWSPDYQILTIHLREGVKWSDGVPFTADDVLFTFECAIDPELSPSSVFWSVEVEGESVPYTMTKIDDYTVRINMAAPDVTLLYKLAYSPCLRIIPKHALAPYHPKYNPDATYQDFIDQFAVRKAQPVLGPWMFESFVPGQQVTFVRNPYYWKVDPAGNQLPYADKAIFRIFASNETLVLNFMQGGIDTYGRFPMLELYPALKTGEAAGNYTIWLKEPKDGPSLLFNFQNPPEEYKSLVHDVRFRKAISLALDRDIIGMVYAPGRYIPTVRTFSPVSPYYDPKVVPEPTYDPERAQALLDEIGLKDTNGDGIREWPSGEDFLLPIMRAPRGVETLTELVIKRLEEVGIKTSLSTPEEDAFITRLLTGDFVVWSDRGMGFPFSPLENPSWWVALGPEKDAAFYLASWELDWNREAAELFKQAQRTLDLEERKHLMSEAQRILSEAYPGVGLLFVNWDYGASNRLGNVPTTLNAPFPVFPMLFVEGFYIKE